MLSPPDRTGSYRVRAFFVHTDVHTDLAPHDASALEALLDDSERRRSALMPTALRRRFVVAHAALRQIVGAQVGEDPAALRWRRGNNGKPYLDGPAGAPQVNLTHSGDLAVVAVGPPQGRAPRGLGVDIEVPGRARPAVRLAARYFLPAEAGLVSATDDPDEQDQLFLRLWTRKEACVKAAGGRLFQGLRLPVAGPAPVTGLVVANPEGRRSSRGKGRSAGSLATDPRTALPGPFIVHDIGEAAGLIAAVALEGTDPFEVTTQWWRPTATPERPQPAAAGQGTEEQS